MENRVSVGWRFPPLSGGQVQGYTNNDIETFKGSKLIDNLSREVCQNSLDAGLRNGQPVVVEFNLLKVRKNDYDVFNGYRKCLNGCRKYLEKSNELNDGHGDKKLAQFLDSAESVIKKDDISLLVVSDYNTKGLNGYREIIPANAWGALTSSNGMSYKPNEDSEGSYGIGKNAPFACSDLSMVFYNTLTKNGDSTDGAFIGVAKLATLYDENDELTQGIGKYQKNGDKFWEPIFPEDPSKFRDLFHRTKPGTDVIIVGFEAHDDWKENIVKAVLSNFFVAIRENKLSVVIKDANNTVCVSADNIVKLFEEYKNDRSMEVSEQLFDTFINPTESKKISIIENDDVEIFLKTAPKYKRKVAKFGASGMFVGSYSKRVVTQFASVVVIRGTKIGELLKASEPPKHDNWDYKRIKDKVVKDRAKDAINQIKDAVAEMIDKKTSEEIPDNMDAVGVSEYLPDDFLQGSELSEGAKDALRIKPEIVSFHRSGSSVKGKHTGKGKKGEGVPTEGEIHNRDKNPTPPTDNKVPQQVREPGDNDSNTVMGVKKGNGTKTITESQMLHQKAFPVNTQIGLYRTIIVPKETLRNVFIQFSVQGETGNQEPLKMVRVMFNSKPIMLTNSNTKAGPIELSANEKAVFYVTFEKHEKMALNLTMTER